MLRSNFARVFVLFLIPLSIFSGCKNSDNKNTTEKPIEVTKPEKVNTVRDLRKAIAALHPSDQKEIFSALPAIYKYNLWQDRMDELIELTGDDAKIDLFQSAKSGLDIAMYTDSAVSQATQEYVDASMTKAYQVYKNDTMKVLSIFTTLGETSESSTYFGEEAAALPNCDCTTYGVDLECHIFDDCKAGGCVKVKRACGFQNIYDCNGLCVD